MVEPVAEEFLHIRPGTGPCEAHHWSDDELPRRLVENARARHGRGGITVCVECIKRAKAQADRMRGRT